MQPTPGYYSILKLDPSDDTGYYAFIRSGIIDGDFDFFNEGRYHHFDRIMPPGYSINYWPFGQSFVWLPFFIVAHLLSVFLSLLGYLVPTDGYSFLYLSLIHIASSCEAFLGLIICYKLLGNFFSKRISLYTTILLFTSTSLPYYTFIRNRMSHSGDVLICSLFFLMYVLFLKNKDRPYAFFAFWGLIAGLIMVFRYTHIAYLLIPFIVFVEAFLPGKMNFSLRKKIRVGLLLGGVSFALVVMPQLTIWKKLHGYFSPMSIMQVVIEPTFSSVFNSMGNLFGGAEWGFLFAEPLWLFGFFGILLFSKKEPQLGGICILILSVFCITPIVIGNGNAFGQRYMLSAIPLLALGLGKLIDVVEKKFSKIPIIAIGALTSCWLYLLLLNYKILLPYNLPQFAIKSFQNIPLLFGELGIFRPTTYLDLILNKNIQLSEFKDYFFLILFPLLLAAISIFLIYSFVKLEEKLERISNYQTFIMRNTTAGIIGFTVILTLFVFIKHPRLSDEERKERLQTASVSAFLKEFPDVDQFFSLILEAKIMDQKDERTRRIMADAFFITGAYEKAEEDYSKIRSSGEKPFSDLQMDRIDVLRGRKILSEALLKEELSKGDPTGEINRWLGIYYLDILKSPSKAMNHFKNSLKTNPEHEQADALKSVILQHSQQKQRLLDRNISADSTPPIIDHMLNTYINFIRLNKIPLEQQF